jgi:hypothetical protein
VVKATRLSQEFDYKAFRARYGEEALVLFIVTESGSLQVCTAEKAPAPKAGQTLICLVDPRLAVTVEPAETAEGTSPDEGEGEAAA